MPRHLFSHRTRVAVPADFLFRWLVAPGGLERLNPPWERVRILERRGGIADGGTVTLSTRVGPFSLRWVSQHQGYVDGSQFQDLQLSGPFRYWLHTHRVEPDCVDAAWMIDEIEFEMPLGMPVGSGFVNTKLARMFAYRHRVTAADATAHFRFAASPKLNVLVSGSSGLVGSALVPFLTGGGHRVTRLVRRPLKDASPQLLWDPLAGKLDPAELGGHDAVVHLAGETIAGRWSARKKLRIRESRVAGTRMLCEVLGGMQRPPKTLIAASAIGIYGDRDAEVLSEETRRGSGFLADVCAEWEAATKAAEERGIRVVHLRLGVVLSAAGGALQKMLLPFKLGAGGIVGSGRQFWSWIALDDAIAAILHALQTPSLAGAVNTVAPTAATNREFTKALGRVLRRPTVIPMPAFGARLAFGGEMADAVLLSSQRVEPRRLLQSGFSFAFPDLEPALRHLLGKD